ncbi:hypothetical protein PIROE2DRAFT_61437 [Piromyces sp. E2]|nr:hypothetical protein PIROE2DRAFT_61437 [Piromyces sp. E2]|eukprot:OUM63172.1 hypothetical protein PIROE2DRAFT_61437 [Piromyces sp. E2]
MENNAINTTTNSIDNGTVNTTTTTTTTTNAASLSIDNSNWVWSDEKLSYYDQSTGWYYREDLGYFYFDENNECHYVYPAETTGINTTETKGEQYYQQHHKKHKHKHKGKKEDEKEGENGKQEGTNKNIEEKEDKEKDNTDDSSSELEEGEISEDDEDENSLQTSSTLLQQNSYMNNGVYYDNTYYSNMSGVGMVNSTSSTFPTEIQLAYGMETTQGNVPNTIGPAELQQQQQQQQQQSYEDEYMRLVVKSSDLYESGSIILIDAEGLSIGRDKSYEKRLRLPEMQVSKYHAKIYLEAEYQQVIPTQIETQPYGSATTTMNYPVEQQHHSYLKKEGKLKSHSKRKYEDLDNDYSDKEDDINYNDNIKNNTQEKQHQFNEKNKEEENNIKTDSQVLKEESIDKKEKEKEKEKEEEEEEEGEITDDGECIPIKENEEKKEKEEKEEEEEGEITDDGEYIPIEENEEKKEKDQDKDMMNNSYGYQNQYDNTMAMNINYEPQPQYTCTYHFSIIDMGSTHGTYVNGNRLSESKICSKPCPLQNGDSIQFGSTTLEVHYHKPWGACKDCTITEKQKEIPLLDKSMMTNQTTEGTGYDPHPMSLEEQRKNELKRLKSKYLRRPAHSKKSKSSGYYGPGGEEEEGEGPSNPYIDRAAQRRELYSTNIPYFK